MESVYVDSLAGIEARLKALQVKPADASAEAFGNLVAALGGNRDKAKALALLFMPYLITGLFELGFTWSLHYAFRPNHLPRTVKVAPQLLENIEKLPAPTQLSGVSDAQLSALRAQFEQPDSPVNSTNFSSSSSNRPREGGVRTVRKKPDGPSPGGWSKEQTLQHVLTELAFGRTIPSQEALKELSGRPKQTVSDWMREWERTRLIPARTQQGRCKSLVAG